MSQSPQDQDGSLNLIILALVVCFLGVYVLSMFSYLFVDFWRYIRIGQLYLISWIPFSLSSTDTILVSDLINILQTNTGKELNGELVKKIDSYITPWTSWLPAIVIFYFYKKLSNRDEGVTKNFSMEGILQHNAKIFPSLKPYLDFHPEEMEDLEYDRYDKVKLQFLPSVSPVEFALMSPPMGLEKEAEKNSAFLEPIWDGKNGFDTDLAERAFKKQLGRTYNGLDNVTKTEHKLYMALMPKIAFDRKFIIDLIAEYLENICSNQGQYIPPKNTQLNNSKSTLIDALSNYYDEQKLKLERVKAHKKSSEDEKHKATTAIILDRKNLKKLSFSSGFQINFCAVSGEKIMESHSYTRTGIMSLLEETRNSGVVAPNQYSWIKGEDRTLWYCINSVGKKVSFTEAGGAYAHWIIEKHIGRSIPQPEVSEAIEALKLQLFIDKRSFDKNKNKEFDL